MILRGWKRETLSPELLGGPKLGGQSWFERGELRQLLFIPCVYQTLTSWRIKKKQWANPEKMVLQMDRRSDQWMDRQLKQSCRSSKLAAAETFLLGWLYLKPTCNAIYLAHWYHQLYKVHRIKHQVGEDREYGAHLCLS